MTMQEALGYLGIVIGVALFVAAIAKAVGG
jgi:hypothetical protein